MLSIFLDIKAEIASIEQEKAVLKKKAVLLQKTKDPDIKDSHIRAMAGCVHGIYTGVENILKDIVRTFDGALPVGEDWHIKLLARSKTENPGTRPAIISEQTAVRLDDLRAFRHIFRGKYHSVLIPAKVKERTEETLRVIPLFISDINAFIQGIEVCLQPKIPESPIPGIDDDTQGIAAISLPAP